MLYDLHCKNKNNWVSYVCFTLYRYGFGFVWENQGVRNTKRFLCEFRQRLIDCCVQDWYSAMASKDRLAIPHKKKSFPCRLFVYHQKSSFKEAFGQIQIRCIPLKKHIVCDIQKEHQFFFTCPLCDTNEC